MSSRQKFVNFTKFVQNFKSSPKHKDEKVLIIVFPLLILTAVICTGGTPMILGEVVYIAIIYHIQDS